MDQPARHRGQRQTTGAIGPLAAGTRLKVSERSVTIRCIECRRAWNNPLERWRAYILREAEPELLPYCPECARREFGRPGSFRR